MQDRVHQNPNLIFSVGTQVVTLRSIIGEGGRTLHPRGSVGVVVRAPGDLNHSYRVRFLDGMEQPVHRDELMMLAGTRLPSSAIVGCKRWRRLMTCMQKIAALRFRDAGSSIGATGSEQSASSPRACWSAIPT